MGDIACGKGYDCLMRVLVASFILLVAIAASGVAGATAATNASIRPVLNVTTPGSLVVSGARFRANERVMLSLMVLGQPRVKVVRTSAVGRLVARFQQEVPDCTSFTISAVGNRGSRALLRVIPPTCGIVIQP